MGWSHSEDQSPGSRERAWGPTQQEHGWPLSRLRDQDETDGFHFLFFSSTTQCPRPLFQTLFVTVLLLHDGCTRCFASLFLLALWTRTLLFPELWLSRAHLISDKEILCCFANATAGASPLEVVLEMAPRLDAMGGCRPHTYNARVFALPLSVCVSVCPLLDKNRLTDRIPFGNDKPNFVFCAFRLLFWWLLVFSESPLLGATPAVQTLLQGFMEMDFVQVSTFLVSQPSWLQGLRRRRWQHGSSVGSQHHDSTTRRTLLLRDFNFNLRRV